MRFILLTLILASLPAQEAKQRFRLDDAKLETLTKKIVPVIEQVSKRSFKQAPKIEIADGATLCRSLTDDFLIQYLQLYRDQSEAKVKRLAHVHASATAAAMLGKYGFESKVLYIVPEQVDLMLDLFKIDRSHGDALFQLVYAHELIHALQDQVVDMAARVSKQRDPDLLLTMSAFLEGHAVYLSEMVAKELGFEAAIPHLRTILGTNPMADGISYAAFRDAGGSGAWTYIGGVEFFEHHEKQGGVDRSWEILMAEPVSSFVILQPELYGELEQHKDLSKALEGVADELGRKSWLRRSGRVNAMTLRSQFVHMSVEAWLKATAKLVGTGMTEVQGVAPIFRGNAQILEFTDEESAAGFASFAQNALQNDFDRLRKKVLPSRLQLDLVQDQAWEGGISAVFRQKPKRFAGTPLACFAVFQQGKHVVHISSLSTKLTDEDLRRLAKDTIARAQ